MHLLRCPIRHRGAPDPPVQRPASGRREPTVEHGPGLFPVQLLPRGEAPLEEGEGGMVEQQAVRGRRFFGGHQGHPCPSQLDLHTPRGIRGR